MVGTMKVAEAFGERTDAGGVPISIVPGAFLGVIVGASCAVVGGVLGGLGGGVVGLGKGVGNLLFGGDESAFERAGAGHVDPQTALPFILSYVAACTLAVDRGVWSEAEGKVHVDDFLKKWSMGLCEEVVKRDAETEGRQVLAMVQLKTCYP